MREFKDVNGNVWRLSLTIGAIERIKAALGFDLLSPQTAQGDDEIDWFNRTLRDPCFELRCVVVACEPQLKEFGYTREDALNCFGGAEAAAAKEAFAKEYQDFFQAIGKNGQNAYLKICKELQTRMQDELEATVSAIDINKLVKDATVKEESAALFGNQSGGLQAKSESTLVL